MGFVVAASVAFGAGGALMKCSDGLHRLWPVAGIGVLFVVGGLLLAVAVRDEGHGMLPRPDSPGLGLGLPLIATLSESLELGRAEDDRTEVRMTFRLEPAGEAA